MSSSDFQHLNDAVRDIWDANADYWQLRMGEGNDFHRELIAPAQERLLALRPAETVLDVACGNGQFARRMADLGARIVALDVSPRMIEHARAHTSRAQDAIAYHVVDATDPAAMAQFGDRQFDAAVCTMALMDMASIRPLAASLARLLRPNGRFVFSVTHPCFNSGRVALVAEEAPDDAGGLVTRYAVRIGDYLTPKPNKGVAMKGQPAPQYYFDRPLNALFRVWFDAGFVLDGLEEPAFTTSAGDGRPNWANITEIPPALVARMRLL